MSSPRASAIRLPSLANFDLPVLALLFIGHLPNRYVTSVLFVLAFVILTVHRPRFTLADLTASLLWKWAAIYILGSASFLFHFSHVNNIFWALFNIAPFFCLPVLLAGARDAERVKLSVQAFVLFELAIMCVQYLVIAAQHFSLNIFSIYSGIGDELTGSLLSFSSAIAVTMGFASLLFLHELLEHRSRLMWFWLVISLLLAFLPGMVSSVFALILALLTTFLVQLTRRLVRFRLNRRLVGVLLVLLVVVAAVASQQVNNMKYGFKILSLMLRTNPPVKVRAIRATFGRFVVDQPHVLFTGVGLGNYSSRAAFLVSGEYLAEQPFFIPVTPSVYTRKYLLVDWGRETYTKIIGGSVGNSMINEPFNQYLTLFGEHGIFGLVLFLVVLGQLFLWGFKRHSSLAVLCSVYVALIFLTNNWIAFPNFALMYWLAVRYAELRETQAPRGAPVPVIGGLRCHRS